jgi:hypothetical protein
MSDDAAVFVQRLDAVRERLGALAKRDAPHGALTAPDPPTGERWEAGHVWAHLAEFIPYWLGEMDLVIEQGATDAVPFGRTKTDAGRIAALERDLRTDRALLWDRTAGDIASLRAFLVGLSPSAWEARGLHSTRGEMDLPAMLDEFLVGHLEQHAAQLQALLS